MGRTVLPLYTPRYIPKGSELAIITTSKGAVAVALNGLDAPLTVGNFIELARRGFYDNLKFHAYKAGSAILGGCPITRTLGPAQVDAAARGVVHGIHPGRGDASYTIKDEYEGKANNHHESGSLVFAHTSQPDSGSCQFYFSLSEQPEYDNSFVVFGQTVEGIAVVQSLRVGDAIESIEIKNADEEALAEAISQEPPRPEKTPTDVWRELQRQKSRTGAQAKGPDSPQ
ncbi:MAG: peptidylprolyl isomerase [Coriobacteriales bacterium]|nr:peptidylprolyl isomerase [Coriobacteriales bacterium]